jgi:integrase
LWNTRGEAESIRWEQIDFDSNVITLPGAQTKSGKPRTIPMSAELATMLQTRKRVGNPFPSPNIRKAWDKARKEAKLPDLLFHDMRRAAISNLTAAGIAPPTAMSISGHRTSATFLRYNISQVKTQTDALQKVVDARNAK